MGTLTYTEVNTALDAAIAETGGKYRPFDVTFYSDPANNAGINTPIYSNGVMVYVPLTDFDGDALQHYVEYGAAFGMQPNAWFDPVFYRQEYSDTLVLSGADLLVHYSVHGANEGRAPSALLQNFDGARYLNENPDVAAYVNANLPDFLGSQTNGAIAHYVKFGALEGRLGYDITGNTIPFTVFPEVTTLASQTGTAANESLALNFNNNTGNTILTGSGVVVDAAGGLDTMRLTGDSALRIDFTNTANQIRGIDLDGDGAIEANGVENNISGAGVATFKNFEVIDAYARNPLNQGDRSQNYTGGINYDGTGYYGDGVSTDGNIFLGGLGSDNAYGGIGNDFLAGGTGGDFLSGGRNTDFFFRELSALDTVDNPTIQGGETTDDSAAGLARASSGWNSQNNDTLLYEASDDDEPSTYGAANFTVEQIESFDASGDLYGFLNDVVVKVGGRAIDTRASMPVAGTENYGFGSTAQLAVTGDAANNVIIGGYDNDAIDGGAGNDILMGGKLSYLLHNRNNPNLLDADGGLNLNTVAGVDSDGRDNLLGGTGNDHIVFDMDGGQVDGQGDTGTTSGDTAKVTGDTLWATDFSMGRLHGATADDEATAQTDALAALTTDSTVRIDLGLTDTVDGVVEFRNYGGSNAETQDQTNYATGARAVTMDGMESVIATGLGALDYQAAGTNTPDLTFNNQQNFFALESDMDLRGSGTDNTLYANTGTDTLEGRGGDDNLSGGRGDDVFVVAFGDGVDTVHRQVDADGDNLWDNYSMTTGRGDFSQDFRAPQAGDIASSHLTIDFGATDLTSPNVAVTSFYLKIGGETFNVTDVATLASAKSANALAAVVNTAFQAIDPDVSAVASGNTIIVTDTEGRDISDTPAEGYAVALTLAGGIVASANPTFTPGGTPINEVENDILVVKTYDTRSINLGANETIAEISNAADMVARFATTGTQLAEGQVTLIKLVDVQEGDTINVTVNGKVYSYTAVAGDNSEAAGAALVTAINNELDLHSGSGRVTAANNAEVAEFDEANTTAGVQDAVNTNAVISLTQTAVSGSQTFMDVSVAVTNTLTGTAAGSATLHNQSNTYVDLVGFDGRNNNIDGDDVLFLGRSATSVSLLETALNAGDTLTGKDATDDLDTALAWINGDDLLIGGDGNDTINGGTGDDVVLMSKGTDTVDGGGNVTEGFNTVAFVDVLQAEQYTFGTGSVFTVALDSTLGTRGAGTVTVSGTATGTTTFSAMEAVRILENSRDTTLDVSALSNSVATAVGSNAIIGTEGLTVNLVRVTPTVTYTIDGNNSGAITAGAGQFESATGDYNAFAATQVFGEENVKTGNANDTVNIDDSQVSANNRIEGGTQQDNTTTYAEGADTVVYDHNSGVLDAAAATATTTDDVPNLTVKVDSASDTDTVTMTGGYLGATTTTDTLVGIEVVDVQDATEDKTGDVLDVSSLGGATVNMGGNVDVKKSLGGDATVIDTVAEMEAETFEAGGVSVTGNGLGTEHLEIVGIAELETVTGSTGSDRVIVGAGMANTQKINSVNGVALGRTTVAGAATDLVFENVGLYQFNLAAGTDSVDYFQSDDDIAVSVDTAGDATATRTHYVLVDQDADGDIATAGEFENSADDRVDTTTGVERFFADADANANASAIDLAGATVATTIEFSKESDDNSNEVADPNGDLADGTVDMVRGTEVRDTSAGTVFARFMDRTNANATGAAYWETVIGSATLAETVILTDNETDVAHNFFLGAGANVIDYSDRTASVALAINSVAAATNTQSGTVDGDNWTVTYAAYNVTTPGSSENTLTVKGSNQNSDTVTIAGLDNATSGKATDSYNLVDLANGYVVEDVLNTVAAEEQGKVIHITGFENITGSDDIDRLYGNGSVNAIDGGTANDWIIGRGGSGLAVGDADQLTGGLGNDRFIFETETDSDGDSDNNGVADVLSLTIDTVTDFAATDLLVFNTSDAGAVAATAAATTIVDGGIGGNFQVEIDQDGDGVTAEANTDMFAIEDTTGNMGAATILQRVSQSSGQDIQWLSNVAAGIDGQYEIVYTSASQSNNLALPDEFHELEIDTAENGGFMDKFDLRSFNFGSFTGDQTAGNGITAADDLNDDGISDLVQGIIYTQPVTVNSLTSVADFFRVGAVPTGVHRAVHVQLEPGDNNDYRVFVDVNRDGNYTQADDLVFDLVDVLDNGVAMAAAATEAQLFDDADADGVDGGDNGLFIFNDAQYNLWF